MSAVIQPELIALANRLADLSGPIVRRYFRAAIPVETKSDLSPVTQADREVEAALRAVIESERPQDGFIGEESGNKTGASPYTWVLDPIDGTKAFICGKPLFGTLIGLLEGDTPVLGVIDQPITGERWIGAAGHATTLSGNTTRTRDCATLSQARLGTTSPRLFSTPAHYQAFERLSEACAITSYGGDCYSYALIATGTIDIVAETGLKLYDYAALIPVIEGAGGIVTSWRGGKPDDGTILACANAELHRAALALLGFAA